MYLTEDIDSLVLFPQENGRFKNDQVICGATYEVHGTEFVSKEFSSVHSSPYGAYANPLSYYKGDLPPPHPPRSTKNAKIKKTIMVVSLHKKGKAKKGRIEYTTVTQVVVSMTPAECNVSHVTDKVSELIGFPAILLDSKCFPLMKNESTSGLEFWKSTRKILAASAALWQQVSGQTIGVNPADQAQGAVDWTCENFEPTPKKVCAESSSAQSDSCVVTVLEKVTKIEKKLAFLDELAQGLSCAICKSVATVPIISPCCQRVVGCESCINNWLVSHNRCPLCNTSDRISGRFKLKGFDQALSVVNVINHEREEGHPSAEQIQQATNSDSDFEDTAPFS